MLRVIGIEALTKGIPANLFAGYFILSLYPNPAQYASSVRMALVEPNLPKCGSAMRPKVIPNEPDRGFNKLKFDLLWFRSASRHRPREVGKRSRDTQHMRGTLRPPLPLAAIQAVFIVVLVFPELLKSPDGFWR